MKKFLKLGVYIANIIIFSLNVFAKNTYFDFSLPSRILINGYEYKIKFSYDISGVDEKDFTVVPVNNNVSIEIFNEEKNLWIAQDSLRTSYPKLASEMLVKFNGFKELKSKICFEIQHNKSTTIYKTPCKIFWNRGFLQQYISLINDKILKWAE